IDAIVLGGHGDLMVPLPRLTMVEGRCITDILPASKVGQIIKRTQNGGAEIVGLLKTGSAYYAPAASTVEMVEAILTSGSGPLPCSVYLNGEYGIAGVYVGLPVRLGPNGVEEIVKIDLSEDENHSLKASADAVRGLIEKIGI
ncbi:MAG: malate dehydrogenase, partial [Nitrospirota bacterium]|nr:malate dehydrogenase [Nitrospirota bacterium]